MTFEEISAVKPYDHEGIFEPAVASLLTDDLVSCLRYCSKFDWWFVAHLTDLLQLADVFNGETAAENNNYRALRQLFVISYGEFLFQIGVLWAESMDYFASCGEYGYNMMAKVRAFHDCLCIASLF